MPATEPVLFASLQPLIAALRADGRRVIGPTARDGAIALAELESADEAYARPAWLGAEVTDLARYYNLALAERPYSRWTPEERDPA